jgi:hypothetical protein
MNDFLKNLIVSANVDKERLYSLLKENTDNTDDLLSVYYYLTGGDVELADTATINGKLCTKLSVNIMRNRVLYTFPREVKGYASSEELAKSCEGKNAKEIKFDRETISSYKDYIKEPRYEFKYFDDYKDSVSIEDWRKQS